MSVQALTWVLEHSESTGNARCVLFAIANQTDREGTDAWPALATIAHQSRCSQATAKRAINELRVMGELDWRRGFGFEGGRRKSNYYWLPAMRLGSGLDRDPPTRAQFEPSTSGRKSSNRRDKGSKPTRQGLTGEQLPVLPVHRPGESSQGDEPEPNIEGAQRARKIREEIGK